MMNWIHLTSLHLSFQKWLGTMLGTEVLRINETQFTSQKDLQSGAAVENKDKCNNGFHGYERNRSNRHQGSKARVVGCNRGRSERRVREEVIQIKSEEMNMYFQVDHELFELDVSPVESVRNTAEQIVSMNYAEEWGRINVRTPEGIQNRAGICQLLVPLLKDLSARGKLRSQKDEGRRQDTDLQ